MYNEIKEILDYLKENEYIRLDDNRNYKLLQDDEDKVLLDYIINLQKENEDLKLQLKHTTHCYDEIELKTFKKKLNDIVEYCRTTQMTFEEFIELERIVNK